MLHAKHAINLQFGWVVLKCRDTDVLLILLYHEGSVDVETWMKSGTAKAKKCFPVLGADAIYNLLGFHSFTGCDTTSSFCGISKNSCWKKYVECPELLKHLLVEMGILRA